MKYLILHLSILFTGLFNFSVAQDIESYLKKANDAREHMNLDIAAGFYSKVLELDPENIDALYYRGWCENLWNKSQGLEDFLKVIELDSLHTKALQSLSDSYAILGKYELAETYELRAIASDPNSPRNLLSQARMANDAKDYESAIKFCDEGIKLEDDGNTWLLVLERAQAYFGSGNYQEAIVDFEKCFNEYVAGLYSCREYEMCGDAFKALGNDTKACHYWNRAIQNEDPDFDVASDEVKRKVSRNCNN